MTFFEKDDLDRHHTPIGVVLMALELELDDDDLVPYMRGRGWEDDRIDAAYRMATGSNGSVCEWVKDGV